MRDNLEMKEGGETRSWARKGAWRTNFWSQKKNVGERQECRLWSYKTSLSTIFENHKASTRTRVLPVQESKNKKEGHKRTKITKTLPFGFFRRAFRTGNNSGNRTTPGWVYLRAHCRPQRGLPSCRWLDPTVQLFKPSFSLFRNCCK